jgi:hypothetical protein
MFNYWFFQLWQVCVFDFVPGRCVAPRRAKCQGHFSQELLAAPGDISLWAETGRNSCSVTMISVGVSDHSIMVFLQKNNSENIHNHP